jgi:hypothetical protein
LNEIGEKVQSQQVRDGRGMKVVKEECCFNALFCGFKGHADCFFIYFNINSLLFLFFIFDFLRKEEASVDEIFTNIMFKKHK